MKKAILAIFCIACLTSLKAQVSINSGIGYSSLAAPTVGLNLQGKIGHLLISAGFDDNISRDKMKGNLVWSRLGGSFSLSEQNTLEATIGAGMIRRSSDVKSLNEGVGVFAVYFVHQMASRPEAGLFAGITTTNKFAIVSTGLRFTFGKGGGYCPSNSR